MRLVLDWDGTCTEVDSLHMVLERFGDREIYERAEQELLAGRMTYRELMEAEFDTVRSPLDEVVEFLLAEARLRPGFHELAELDPIILSSGFVELIEPVLAREGVTLEVRANSVDARRDAGSAVPGLAGRPDPGAPPEGRGADRRREPEDRRPAAEARREVQRAGDDAGSGDRSRPARGRAEPRRPLRPRPGSSRAGEG